ncbi:VapE domain-containing protein [Acinetobacter baumannii]|uniref:VapE domain-containing protein n=1 Tax=Acinetobacter baumannii TaxID=470 RepID=UPI003B437B66
MSKAAYQDLSVDTIIDALGFIDPDQDRKSWARIGMAIKSELGESGFSVFDDWSKGGSKYNKADVKTTWRSIRASKGKDVTIATLIYEAQQGGFAFNDNDRVKISDEEIAARKAKREAEERKAAAELKQIRGEVARLANLAWEAATPAYEHPYTTRKGVKINGARIGEFPVYKVEHGKPITPFKTIPALLVPIHEKKGKIVSLQAYFFEDQDYYGDRAYLKDGQKQGGYCLIGNPDKRTIAIVEGYATGLSVYEATGWAVMVAFDCGNLMNVAKIARDHFPQSEIIIAGDNDANGAGNKAAEAAGKAINARVILPNMEGMDWNDVHATEGIESVQSQLMAHKLPAPANDNDETPLHPFEVVDAMARHGVNLATNTRLEPYSNLANAIAVLRGHPKFSGRIWYDTFHQEMFTTWDCEQPRKWVDADRLRVTEIFQRQFGLVKFSDDTVEKAAIAVAQENQRDELREWLLSLQWDGQARLNGWMEKAAGVPRDEYHDVVGANFLRSLVARGLTPGCKVDTMPVFEGKQGLRKSTMLEVLGGKFYSELKESLETKDFFVAIQGVWLVEVGEMQSMKKADVTRIKQILSSRQDRCRLPYARRAADLPRRVVFAGTTNEGQYLRDPTGARRFWPIACEKIDLQWLENNREQLFAEAVYQVRNGATWWEVPEDAAREQTDGRRETDPWEDFISEKFQFRNRITTSEVLDALDIPLVHQTSKEQRRIADALKALGFERKKTRLPGSTKPVWAYVRQSPVIEIHEPAF